MCLLLLKLTTTNRVHILRRSCAACLWFSICRFPFGLLLGRVNTHRLLWLQIFFTHSLHTFDFSKNVYVSLPSAVKGFVYFFSFDWLCCLARVLRTAVFSYAQQMFYVRCSKRSDNQIYQDSYHKWTRYFLELWSALFSEHAYFKPAK